MMNELLKLLGSLAPALATVVAGPLGGMAVSAIASKLGVEDTVEAVTKAISADPEAALKLAQIDLDKLKAEYANTADARDMQKIALQQSDIFSKRFTMYLTTFWSVAATVYIGFITFSVIPDKNVRFADTILGFILGTVVATLLNFWFGSSIGSKEKGEVLRK
jgi:VIT1/CCC1 family predicted Fe2+/Mn2+ transporter